MGLIEELQNLSDTIKEYSDQDLDEANTEMSCLEPFIELLGYQRTLTDMQRQYPADMRGGAKPKTVDYAIKKDDAPIMIVECKQLGEDLDAHTGQLEDYFAAVSEARFGILTDGRLYRFYTDLDKPNLMDSKPFLEFDLFDIQRSLVAELERFTKSRFDLDEALAAASDLKYSKAIQQFLTGQLESPTEDFVNHITSATSIAINTPERRQRITEIIQQTLKAFKDGGADSPSPDPESDNGGETDESSSPTVDLDSYEAIAPDETWRSKKIGAFTFNGKEREVKRWNEFLEKFCEILSEDYSDRFEEVLQVKPHHFSKNPDTDFPKGADPKLIGSTGFYVQAAINNNVKKEIVKDLVEHFGCNMPVLYVDKN
ncbi:hypothetical protein F4X33_16350 [Candidatus Poribacteria bacterium]|nr:hypothetical protein [Candidatus Poribacteria bacterium]